MIASAECVCVCVCVCVEGTEAGMVSRRGKDYDKSPLGISAADSAFGSDLDLDLESVLDSLHRYSSV